MKKVLIAILILTVYLNIGWALGTYYHNDIFGHKPQTLTQKVLCGGGEFFAIVASNSPLLTNQCTIMFFWPILLSGVLFTWVIWLIFAGGVAKLLGIG